GDDAGTGRGGTQNHAAGAPAPGDVVMQGATFLQRHADHAALGGIRGLPNGLRHLAGLAVAETHATLLVTDDDEGGEAEAATALSHLGDAIDVDQAIHDLAVALLALTRLPFSSDIFFSTDAGRL